jgi:plastocyanin
MRTRVRAGKKPARGFWAAIAVVYLAILFIVPGPAAAEEEDKDVEVFMVKGHIFSPLAVHVQRGFRVIFSNRDEDLHALTLTGHENLLDEVYLEKGEGYVLTIPEDLPPQTLEIRCSIHMEMRAIMVIE